MKTDLNQLLFETQQDAQKLLNVNDPGYTIIMENGEGRILDPNGVIVAKITKHGVEMKTLL